MITEKELTKLFQLLEKSTLSLSEMKLVNKPIDYSAYLIQDILNSYIHNRLKNGIHPDNLLNMAYHFETIEKCSIGRLINRQIIRDVISNQKYYDHFYYMCRHDIRKENHILKSLAIELAHGSPDQSLKMIDKIVPHIGGDKYTLIVDMFSGKAWHQDQFLTDLLDLEEDKYKVIVRAIQTNNVVISFLQDDLIRARPLYKFVSNYISINGDKDQLAMALRSTTLDISILDSSPHLSDLLMANAEFIPQTIDHLSKRAAEENCWEYVLILGNSRNKKELLRDLVKSKNVEIIDRFFSLYKDCPEVKHLTPFI